MRDLPIYALIATVAVIAVALAYANDKGRRR